MHGTSYSRILALDLGKFNSVLCVFDPATAGHAFVSLPSSRQMIHDRLVEHATADPKQTLVVFETCESSGWVHDVTAALGFSIAVANPSNEAWRWTKVKRKTDRDDALKLAKMASMDQLPTVHMPPPDQRQKRRLVHHRRSLIQRRTMVKNQIRSIFGQQGIPLPRGGKCWTKGGVEQLKAEARPLSDCDVDELWRGRLDLELRLLASVHQLVAEVDHQLQTLADEKVNLLMTVPGVGIGLAQTVVVHLDDPEAIQDRLGGRQLRGSDAQTVPERPDEPQRPRHPARSEPAAGDAGGGGVDGLPPQRLGEDVCEPGQPRHPRPQEDCHRGTGQKTAGDALGDAAGQPAVAQPGGDARSIVGGRTDPGTGVTPSKRTAR